jgi:hypothetical protein
LIKDLDNPFGYYERYSGADVSLKPLEDTVHRLAQIASIEVSTLKRNAERIRIDRESEASHDLIL